MIWLVINQVQNRKARYYNYLITSILDLSNILKYAPFGLIEAVTHMVQKLKSSDPVVKIHQHYLNIYKTFRLFRKSYIGVYGPDIEILVSEFTTVRFSISLPRRNQNTKVNRPNLMRCIIKNCQILGTN